MWYPAFLIIAILIYFICTLPIVKGWLGELTVRMVLLFLDKKQYRIFNNVFFPAYNGLYMQIDHLVVGRGSVIVIETKNYNGIIEGDWRSRYWSVKRKNHSGKAYNPMRQNSYHVRMLRENHIVNDLTRIYPVVCLGVFAKPEINGKMPVVTPQKLLGFIKKLSGESTESPGILDLSEKISGFIIKGRGIAGEHVKRLRMLGLRKREGRCPRCGGKLYYRNSLRGRIAICTNYPWCKYRNKT